VALGEDACRAADLQGAEVLASLRNLTNGLYELERARARTKVAPSNRGASNRPFQERGRYCVVELACPKDR
jgi:hypothetical protein